MYKDYYKKLFHCLESVEYSTGKGKRLEDPEGALEEIVQIFRRIKKEKRQLFFIGNGGSAAIANHMTADFMKNGGMHTVSLYSNALTTCMGNDYGYEYVFSTPLEFLGKEDDLLVTVSSSGNSKNIINAIETAKRNRMRVITLSGFKPDNESRILGDYNIYIPMEHYGIVESIHNLLLQQIVDVIMEEK